MIDVERGKQKALLLQGRAKLYLPFACMGTTTDSHAANETAKRIAAKLEDPRSEESAVYLAAVCAAYEMLGMPKEPVSFCSRCGKVIAQQDVRCHPQCTSQLAR